MHLREASKSGVQTTEDLPYFPHSKILDVISG
jgi:hypothetical protein